MIVTLDADRIIPGLYQGSYPGTRAPRDAGFDVLVLCAREMQARDRDFPGVAVIRVPLHDDGLTLSEDEWLRAQKAGAHVAQLVHRGANVLTTCAAGLNRSGLVNAVALLRLFPDWTGDEVVGHIQACRPDALVNRAFARAIRSVR